LIIVEIIALLSVEYASLLDPGRVLFVYVIYQWIPVD